MSNLSKETIDKIRESASDKYNLSSEEGERIGYQVGATEWTEKAQGLVEFIEYVINFPPAMSKSAMSEWIDKVRDDAREYLAKYKEVTGG